MNTEGGAKVLVIDDEACMRDSCAQVLRKQGLSVEVASDGESGLKMAGALKPDLTILDLKMPGMQGQDVLVKMRELHPDGIVVVMTGYPTLESAVEAIKAGAYDFLPKPFTPPEIRTIVARALEKRALLKRTVELEKEKQRIQNNLEVMLSHQMKTPLVAIMQYVSVLEQGNGVPLGEKPLAILGRIHARVRQLLKVVDNFLKLSKLERLGKIEDAKEVNLQTLLHSAWEAAGAELGGKKLQFRLAAPEDAAACCAKGDEFLLHEAFFNLLSNSVKYTPDGGSVCVEVLPAKDAFVTVKVSDSGVGIPPEECPYVFDEFFRGKSVSAGSKCVPGTGLGLTIVKRVVKAHQGTVSVSSEVGRGTTFTVSLPKA